MLSVRGLTAGYGPIGVLSGIAFDLGAGEVLAVLGPNGAGKTTLLRALSRLIPSTGEIVFDGRGLARTRTHVLARLGIAHVPEHRGTFAELSVDENLELGAYAVRAPARDRDRTRDEIFAYFPRLRERRTQQAGSLSGGEQQMLAIGRALASRPRLLLLDEPSFGLAPQIVREIYDILHRLRTERDVGMIVVEQHGDLALELADRAIVLGAGQVVLSESAAVLRTSHRLQDSYLGSEPH